LTDGPGGGQPRIFHIVARQEWLAAVEADYQPASLGEQGFVHFSYAHQVAAVANNLYRQRDGLIVIEVDRARLPAEVVEEDLYDAGESFPHVYAAIPVSAAVAEYPLRRNEAGDYVFTPPPRPDGVLPSGGTADPGPTPDLGPSASATGDR
jgi:uncharacterized protein (DUF952 family)